MNFGVTSLAAPNAASSRAARYSPTGRGRRQTRGALDAIAVTGVGLDQTGIDGKTLAANEALVDTALEDSLEQPPQ
jgi:hypothetical protein